MSLPPPDADQRRQAVSVAGAPAQRSLTRAVIVSIAISVCTTIIVLIVTLAAIGSQVEPSNNSGDDMSGLWVIVVGGLILITVGPLSLIVAFVVVSRRYLLAARARWTAVFAAVLLLVAAVAALVVRSFLVDRGVGPLWWLAAIGLAAVAVATPRLVLRYHAGRADRIALPVGIAVVLGSLAAGGLNADRHARAVSFDLIERRRVTLALPIDDGPWSVVDIASPTGYRATDSGLTVTLRDADGREVAVHPVGETDEPCRTECVTVATITDGRRVRDERTSDAVWYIVDADTGHWTLLSDDALDPDEAAGLVEQLRPVTTDEWLDADMALGSTVD